MRHVGIVVLFLAAGLAAGCGGGGTKTVTVTKTAVTTPDERAAKPGQPVSCNGPHSTRIPILRLEANGTATCADAEVLVSQCADGDCDGKDVPVGRDSWACTGPKQESVGIVTRTCASPGAFVTWTGAEQEPANGK